MGGGGEEEERKKKKKEKETKNGIEEREINQSGVVTHNKLLYLLN
jgi:hypothetical protein